MCKVYRFLEEYLRKDTGEALEQTKSVLLSLILESFAVGN